MSVDFQWTTRNYIPEDRTFVTTAVRTSNPTNGELTLCFIFVSPDQTVADGLGCAQPPEVLAIEILKDGSLDRTSGGREGLKERKHGFILLLDGSVVGYGFS
jgi:hypothetical protein